jgi:hypothetical protein
MDICAWLRGLGLERYEQAFRDNAIDEAILPKLTAEDLKDLGVTAVIGSDDIAQLLLDASAALRGEPVHDTAQHSAEPGRSGAKAPEAERRLLTVMFADLIGSTALSARARSGGAARYHRSLSPPLRRGHHRVRRLCCQVSR